MKLWIRLISRKNGRSRLASESEHLLNRWKGFSSESDRLSEWFGFDRLIYDYAICCMVPINTRDSLRIYELGSYFINHLAVATSLSLSTTCTTPTGVATSP